MERRGPKMESLSPSDFAPLFGARSGGNRGGRARRRILVGMTDHTTPLSPDPRPDAKEAAPAADSSPTLPDAPSGAPQREVGALSARHERFVLEFLKDGNATQAYIRAGYSPRGAQPSASRLLRDARIAAAVAAGRQRLVETLEVSVERLAQEYAKIAFANVTDYVSTSETGGLRVDLDKASDAQRAGILELRISNHRNPEQRQITLKLGKLQALAALTKNVGLLGKKSVQALTAEDRQYYEERHAADRREVESSNERYWKIQERLRVTEAALARAEYDALAAKRAAADRDTPKEDAGDPRAIAAPEEKPPIVLKGLGPPDPPRPRRSPPPPPPPSMEPPPEVAGAGRGTIFWRIPDRPPSGPTWHEIIRHSRFPGQ